MSKRCDRPSRHPDDKPGTFTPGKPFVDDQAVAAPAPKARVERQPSAADGEVKRDALGRAIAKRGPDGRLIRGPVTEAGRRRKARALARRGIEVTEETMQGVSHLQALRGLDEAELAKQTRRVIDSAKTRDAAKLLTREEAAARDVQRFHESPRTFLDAPMVRLDAAERRFDVIALPKHYNQGKIEVWDFIVDQKLGYLEGNVIKYLARYRHKNGLEDLKKARAYLNKLIKEQGGE